MGLLLKVYIHLSLVFLTLTYETKRLFVFEQARHGARAPWQTLNTKSEDIFGEKWSGVGELTSVGLRMHFLLGVRNKKRYTPFLNPYYDPNEILVYSTNTNRTIQSIGAQLQGLFPIASGPQLTNDQSQIENETLPFNQTTAVKKAIKELGLNALPNQMNIVPIHIFNPYDREFSLNDNDKCHALKQIKEHNVKSKQMQRLAKRTQETFNKTFSESLFKYFNITNPDYYFDMDRLYNLADIFISTYTDGRKMLKLKKAGIDFDKLYEESLRISYLITYLFEFTSEHNYISIMAMSPTYRKILYWMDRRYQLDKEGRGDESVESSPKMVIYSGHDTTLATNYYFMHELFNSSIEQSFFTSNLYLELVKKNNKDYFVQFYSNDRLMIEIPYAKFNNTVSRRLWSRKQIEEFCDKGIREEKGVQDDLLMIIAAFLGSSAAILGASLCVLFYKRKSGQTGVSFSQHQDHFGNKNYV